MANKNLKVYLDHHIPRDNLLYRRAATPDDLRSGKEAYLKIEHLLNANNSRAYLLRKPDFQRATSAWSPEDCVSLLESVLTEQVVPSVILWLSPDRLWYVLDGGHRISVFLAWIRNDWGDRRPANEYKDATLYRNSIVAANRVRELLPKYSIRPFQEYVDADSHYKDLQSLGRNPQQEMSQAELSYAEQVREWLSLEIGFPILWVKGDYEKAEESFLKINKSGRQLSSWETTLVENRRSSFARAVMSVSRVFDKEHCWPINDPTIRNDQRSRQSVVEILEIVQELHNLLFTPGYETPISRPQQPLIATPYTRPELQPAYLSELLTITEGNKGQPPETRKLLQRDAKEPVPVMVANGRRLLMNAQDVIENITGPSPRSLNLMPLVYFYNSFGTYVRSLLYGMIYWLNRGSETDILTRKRLFSVHRSAFETVLLADKDRIIGRITRRIGSGPEVTYQTAMYFDGLLRLLIEHRDAIQDPDFQAEHNRLIETLSPEDRATDVSDVVSHSRGFRGRSRASVIVSSFVDMFRICPICGGRFYPNHATQVDHVRRHARGGTTTPNNGRETHPFCNNQRGFIESIKENRLQISLPSFEDPKHLPKSEQLSFLDHFLADNMAAEDVSDEDGSEDYDEAEEDERDEDADVT